MQVGETPKKVLISPAAGVIVMAVLALVAAMIIVPPLALQMGLFEKHVGYAMATVAGLIVIVAVRRVRTLNAKAVAEKAAAAKSKRRRRR